MKYLDGLGYDASFILHSDPKQEYTVFGEQPFASTPLRQKKQGVQEWWPGHKVGAICITPTHLKNLDGLLRCLLMYHARLVSVCWNRLCHSLLTEENGGLKKQPQIGIGDYYQCPNCGDFWISSKCSGRPQHFLVKMGRDSFHKVSTHNEWNCTCPVCGDAFKAEIGRFAR